MTRPLNMPNDVDWPLGVACWVAHGHGENRLVGFVYGTVVEAAWDKARASGLDSPDTADMPIHWPNVTQCFAPDCPGLPPNLAPQTGHHRNFLRSTKGDKPGRRRGSSD